MNEQENKTKPAVDAAPTEMANIAEPTRKKRKAIPMPVQAIIFDAAGAAAIGLAALFFYLNWDSFSLLMFLLFALGGLILPVIGIAYAIASLCNYKSIGKSGIALSIVTIAAPVLTVIIIVALFATGVMYIRFM